MREIDEVIIHCSATEEGVEISADTIRKWHTSEPRNWDDIGYHYVIGIDGGLEYGRPVHKIGAHCLTRNRTSIGVCYIGGLRNGEAVDTMTQDQEDTMRELCCSLKLVFGDLKFNGHNRYSTKTCPNFDVREKFKNF